MKKIKIAQIGIGHDHAAEILHTLKNSDQFELLGYAVPPEDQAFEEARLKHYEGVPRLSVERLLALPGLEAVTVETNEHDLTRYALRTARRGLHLHVDKPGGEDGAEMEELLRTAKAKGLIFSTGYMYRFNPEVQALFARIKRGELGRILNVEAHMDCDHTAKKRAWLGEYRGGMTYFLGCHLIDLVLQIMGTPDRIVPFNHASGKDGTVSLDQGFCVMTYPHAACIVHSYAAEPGGVRRRQLVVTGEKETVVLEPLEYPDETPDLLRCGVRECPAGAGWFADGTRRVSAPFHRYAPMLESFAACVRGEKQPPVSYEYECRLHRAVLAASGIDADYRGKIHLTEQEDRT